MKLLARSFCLLWALLAGAAAHADAGLRIVCEGDSVDAEVKIDGVFKGECPVDLKVPAGTAKVSVRKKMGDKFLWFYQEFRLGDGSLKKVDVWPLVYDSDSVFGKAEGGDPEAMHTIFNIYNIAAIKAGNDAMQSGKDKDSNPKWAKNCEQAIRWGLKAIDAGRNDGVLFLNLASIYKEGCGTEVDLDKASQFAQRGIPLLKSSAEKGDGIAMFNLALTYAKGNGVAQNRAEAVKWARKAKDAGGPDILKALGAE